MTKKKSIPQRMLAARKALEEAAEKERQAMGRRKKGKNFGRGPNSTALAKARGYEMGGGNLLHNPMSPYKRGWYKTKSGMRKAQDSGYLSPEAGVPLMKRKGTRVRTVPTPKKK